MPIKMKGENTVSQTFLMTLQNRHFSWEIPLASPNNQPAMNPEDRAGAATASGSLSVGFSVQSHASHSPPLAGRAVHRESERTCTYFSSASLKPRAALHQQSGIITW